MKTHLDLCSGIGGFALAAETNGFRTIGFCELDEWCGRVLAKHYPGVPIHRDLKTLTSNTVRGWLGGEPLGLITAGYPCQPFSLAGKRQGQADPRHLWPFIARLVAETRPALCLFENVSGHISMGLDDVLFDLESLGYAAGAVVVPACAVNAPHRRDRVWIMAHAEGIAEREPANQADSFPIGGQAWQELGGRGDDAAATSPNADDDERRAGVAEGRASDWQLGLHAGWPQGASSFTSHRGRARAGRSQTGTGTQAQSGMGGAHDGLPGRMARALVPFGPDWEAGVPRTIERGEDDVQRLTALGNAIVPHVAAAILEAMLASESKAASDAA